MFHAADARAQPGDDTSKSFTTKPHDFIAAGDKVVVLATFELEGETVENADVLTYDALH